MKKSLFLLPLVALLGLGLASCDPVEPNICETNPEDPSCDEGPVVGTKYNVTFDLGYVGSAASTVVEVVRGEKVARPADDPVRADHSFEGWHLGANLFDFNTAINSNITLLAKWEPVVITHPDWDEALLEAMDMLFGEPLPNLPVGDYFWAFGPEFTDNNPAYTYDLFIVTTDQSVEVDPIHSALEADGFVLDLEYTDTTDPTDSIWSYDRISNYDAGLKLVVDFMFWIEDGEQTILLDCYLIYA